MSAEKSANSTAGAEKSREDKLSLLKSVLSAVFVIATSDICALLCRGLQGKDEQRDAVAECSEVNPVCGMLLAL